MVARLRSALPAIVGLLLFVAALEILRTDLRAVTWNQLAHAVLDTPPQRLIEALLFTFANYAVLTGYDFLALAYIGKSLPSGLVALTSFLAYAIANNVGWSIFSGASIRYRFYVRRGVTAEELARIVFSYSATFWVGLLLLGGLSFAISPLPAALDLSWRWAIAPLGWMLMASSFAYVALAIVRRDPLRIRGFELRFRRRGWPSRRSSCRPWSGPGCRAHARPSTGADPFLVMLGVFLAAQLLGLASHVPGGVGIFEGLMVLLLKPFLSSAELLPPLVMYRVVYYLLPLTVALFVLVADELHQRREQAARVGAALGRLTEQVTSRVLAVFTFLSGIILLFSGATPAAAGRLALLDRIVPLGVIETSHFVGSLVGAALLLLAQRSPGGSTPRGSSRLSHWLSASRHRCSKAPTSKKRRCSRCSS